MKISFALSLIWSRPESLIWSIWKAKDNIPLNQYGGKTQPEQREKNRNAGCEFQKTFILISNIQQQSREKPFREKCQRLLMHIQVSKLPFWFF